MKKILTLECCFQENPYLRSFHVYIDGSNVAFSRNNKYKKPALSDVLLLYDYLINDLGFRKGLIHCICDPSLKYQIDKPIEFEILIKEGLIVEAPKVADEFILSFALKHDFCYVCSNDRFKTYINQLPSKNWIKNRRISFMFIGDKVCLSPQIDYKIFSSLILNNEINEENEETEIIVSTLGVLNKIENSKGDLDLF